MRGISATSARRQQMLKAIMSRSSFVGFALRVLGLLGPGITQVTTDVVGWVCSWISPEYSLHGLRSGGG